MRLLISGGGTGGHVYPALTVADAMRNRARVELMYLGRADSVESRLAERTGIPFRAMETGQVRGMSPWIAARSLWRMYRSVGTVRAFIREFQPNAVFVTGGYVSAPVIWASAAEKIPSVIYLPDLEPGWAIRATARWATRVAVSFPQVEKHFARGKAVVTGYPVRSAFFQVNRNQARAKFQLDAHAPTVAIFGGSSGAHHINQAVVANLDALARIAQVIHLTGRADESWVGEQVVKLPDALRQRVRAFGYLDDDVPDALGAADVVVARAGAATLGEFPALGLPAILVPGPYAGLHQERNADFLVTRGAARKINDAALKDELLPMLKQLFAVPEKLNAMRDAMHALAQPRAAENLADLLREIAIRNSQFAGSQP
ncbi:MAG: undecaprenyldiphospho-muramoylpentapeptide beta-N-acetylglucosaminyltransferase [Chloroflexi bacterium]|nr:undecaprenyldiphospho-muramoylpentapeptide beta-N-acetylglucosaminyltransferase [Chloroflexota bacterium]